MADPKYRIRACGMLIENHKILLVELLSPITNSLIWIPPGGGVDATEDKRQTVKREFREETGLEVVVEDLLHENRFIHNEYHVEEYYYRVIRVSGKLELGTDPEYSKDEQILKQIDFKSKEELSLLNVVPEYIRLKLWQDLDLL